MRDPENPFHPFPKWEFAKASVICFIPLLIGLAATVLLWGGPAGFYALALSVVWALSFNWFGLSVLVRLRIIKRKTNS